MSLEVQRDGAVTAKRSTLSSTLFARRNHLRALRAITILISRNSPLSTLTHRDFATSPSADADEAIWLESNDLKNGRYFDDTTIPFPSLTQDADFISASKPKSPSRQSPKAVKAPIKSTPSTREPSPALKPASTTADDSMKLRSGPRSTFEPTDDAEELLPSSAQASKPSLQSSRSNVVPDDVAPPQPEEEAHLSGATQQLLDNEHPQRSAKVVHLAEPLADGTRASADVNHSTTNHVHNHHPGQTELASSPSSTVGAYSTATPLPPQDSPDTSPDSERAEQLDEVQTPKDLRPSPEEQRQKEEHDRLLEAQKEIARKQALGDVSTADEQLRWEEREAAARDQEEQAARQRVGGPAGGEISQAEEVVEEMEVDEKKEQIHSSAPTSKQPELEIQNSSAEDDGDNITVRPRTKAPPAIDTSNLQQSRILHTSEKSHEPESSNVRASVDGSEERSLSHAVESPVAGDEDPPLSAVSPLTTRPSQDVVGTTSIPFQTPRKAAHGSNHATQTPPYVQAALSDLLALKGAANDPDRDYLESLFRIQAHDSPNVRTTPLPDLVRSASKSLSTEDHFTALHERVDYRMLRKIYTLQNANKWSLRQMERAKEPDPSVTHYDHMMAEMKWMRKDFRSERKMKKSICAWLAQRCADWVAADAVERRHLQVKIQPSRRPAFETSEEHPPELEHSGDSAPEDEPTPPTPSTQGYVLPSSLVVPPELSDTVSELQKTGKLTVALRSLPIVGLESSKPPKRAPLEPVSKFIDGTVLPTSRRYERKRSRFDYEDDAELIEAEPVTKRQRSDRELAPEDQDIALFHPENKAIRDRLHANNTFRPPSEFAMPSTQFYEFRNGSQWVWEDDQKLKKLAKEYSFNWSLISDELTLPASFKSSAERRTPWECFERWVDLEQMPSEMRKTVYFKTWYQRLEQSQQAAERRYQAQVAALQAANGQGAHVPTRRRTVPTRVDKRKNMRYLWLVDAMRKLARKKEAQAYKQAEAQRAAAQRKSQTTDTSQQRAHVKTPKEWSEIRHNHDMQQAERFRQHREKMLAAQKNHVALVRAQQQGGQQANQQRPATSSTVPVQQAQMQANGHQHQPNMNGQIPQQGRPPLPIATRNGHLAVPQVNAQGIPQAAQMRPNGQMQNPQDMQRIAHANAQARNAQYGGQQYAPMQPSPGTGAMGPQQQMQSNQALLANMQHQNGQQGPQQATNHQMSGSPSMPPPPTPQNAQKTLSSGHVPAILGIQNSLRVRFPQISEDQITNMATEMLRNQSQSTSQTQARQNAMNAAAGLNGTAAPQPHGNMQPTYSQNHAAFQNNQQMQNGNAAYMNGDNSGQQASANGQSPQQYAALMRQRQMQQMRLQQSPNGTHATLNSSPGVAHSSPNMAPESPVMQFSNTNNNTPQMAAAQLNMGQQRPPSRPGSATPQIQRLGSSGSLQQGMPSPGLQGSPRMQASMAR